MNESMNQSVKQSVVPGGPQQWSHPGRLRWQTLGGAGPPGEPGWRSATAGAGTPHSGTAAVCEVSAPCVKCAGGFLRPPEASNLIDKHYF